MDDPDNGGEPPEGEAAVSVSLAEPISVINYMKRIVPVLMEEEPGEITKLFEVRNNTCVRN